MKISTKDNFILFFIVAIIVFNFQAHNLNAKPDCFTNKVITNGLNCTAESLPYQEDFENGFDSCWDRDDVTTSFISSVCRENPGSFLQLNGGTHTTTTNAIDVSSESSIEVSWDIFNGCNNAAEPGENLIVDYWDGNTWQNIITYDPANLGDKWTRDIFTITSGLTANFKVRFVRPAGTGSGSNADDISIDNFEVKASLSCTAASIPYTEDFESNEIDDCWFQSNSFQSQIVNTCDSNSTNFLQLKGGVHYIDTKEIDVTASCSNSVDVNFDIYNGCDEPAEAGENLKVQYWNGNSWQLIFSYDPVNLPDGWSEQSHTISNGLTSSFKVRFERPSGTGSGFNVDDINIDNFEVVESIITIPYEEDFENGLSCWEVDNPSSSFIANNCSDNNSNFLQLNGGFHSTTSKLIDVSEETSIDVSWEIFNGCNNLAEAGENLVVDYWNGTSWQNIVTYDPATDLEENWELKRYTITSGLTSSFKLRFTRPDNTGSGTNADDIDIDNVKVTSTPSCNFPLNVEVTTITSTTVNFNWGAEVSATEGYEYVLMPSGVLPNISTSIDSGFNTASLPINSLTNANFTQLNPSTSYDIYVRSKCGASEFSQWSKKESFETDCAATSLPYAEDFETGVDTCWSRTDSNQSFVASNCSNSNGDYLQFKGGSHTTETSTIDVSNADEIEINFSIYNGCDEPAEAGENLVIEYWNDSEWQNLDTLDPINLSSSWEEKNYTVDASSFNNLKLRFIRPDGTGSGENADDINIDDLEIFESLNNPDFLVEDGTCKCPDASFGDFGEVTINGEQKIFTKRSRAQLDALIAADIDDPQIALTCTSGITDMSNLFDDTDFNQNINSWDVSNVTNMFEMFRLSTFNQPLDNWDVSNVENMEKMFFGTPFNKLINSWNVSNVTNMKGMFTSSLFNQPLNNWNVANVTDMENMFLASSFNQNINQWDVSNVTNMKAMFSQALDFNQPLNDWDVSNVVNMSQMFRTAHAFNQPLDNWNLANATNMRYMFLQALSFNQDISGWCTPKIYFEPINFSAASPLQDSFKPDWSACNNFYLADNEVTCMCPDAEIGETGIIFIDGNPEFFTKRTRAQLDALVAADINDPQIAQTCTSGITDMSNLFISTDFNQNIESWDVSNVTNMSRMFGNNTTFNQPLNSWDVSNVTNTFQMFVFASSFNRPLNNWDVSNVTNMRGMFSFTDVFNQHINDWDVSNVTLMEYMFRNAKSFNQPLNNWDVSNVTAMDDLFNGAEVFNQPLNDWDVSNVTNMKGMFFGAVLFDQALDNWDVSNVTNMQAMFFNAQSFDQNLSGWCVEQIDNEPNNFSDNSALSANNKPNWGAPCSNFYVENNTCKCPDANFGDSGQVTINGQQQTFTKRTRAQLDALIAADINDPQIALTCTSGITDMSNLFEGTDINQDINSWDVSNVTTMNSMFKDVSISFNQPLGNWDTSNVTDMSNMFYFAYAFNQNINSWDVSNVTSMQYTFYRAAVFNEPLDNWDVSNVTNMTGMFQQTTFNQSINSWDVSNVTSMANMFALAQSFDQPLNNWEVTNLTNANFMFANAFSFNQDISSWCVEQINSEPTNFSTNSPLSVNNKPNWGNACNIITWNGNSWVNGTPNENNAVIIDGDYNENTLAKVKELTVNSGKTLNIYDKLQVDDNIENNGNIIFKSTNTKTGQLDEFTGTYSGTGSVTVEQFIPAGDNNRRVFRFLSSPLTTSTSIRDNWQEGAVSNTDNPNPGFGTHITGSTTDGVNGFDGTISGAPSLLIFDNATQTWEPIDNTDVTTLEAGNAYNLFVRGDRSIDLTSNSQTPTNTVLRATGSLTSGSVDFTSELSTATNGFNLIGNPYQAIVDFTSLTTTDLKTAFFFVWDPNGGTAGNYVAFDGSLGEEMMIQPGQSIFVQNSVAATSPALVFNQDDKNPSGAVTSVFNTSQLASVNLELYNTNDIKLDVMKFRFEAGADNGIDDFDAGKLGNPTENLASVNGNTLLSIERRDLPKPGEILPLFINQYQDSQYEFRLNTLNLNDNFEIYIVDNYSNTETLISENQAYSFNVDSNIPESTATDRFNIGFENTTLGVSDNNFGNNFSLYPNPTKDGLFSIKTQNLNADDVEIRILNLMGQQVMKQNHKVESNGEINVNASNLSSGVYMVELSQNNQNFTTKLIIQ